MNMHKLLLLKLFQTFFPFVQQMEKKQLTNKCTSDFWVLFLNEEKSKVTVARPFRDMKRLRVLQTAGLTLRDVILRSPRVESTLMIPVHALRI